MAVVKDGVAHFVPVQVELDMGSEVLLSAGLSGDEAVVANPGERLVEGVTVTVAESKAGP